MKKSYLAFASTAAVMFASLAYAQAPQSTQTASRELGREGML